MACAVHPAFEFLTAVAGRFHPDTFPGVSLLLDILWYNDGAFRLYAFLPSHYRSSNVPGYLLIVSQPVERATAAAEAGCSIPVFEFFLLQQIFSVDLHKNRALYSIFYIASCMKCIVTRITDRQISGWSRQRMLVY